MADRGRDLKFSILSDVGQFDTDKPARGLDDLGDSANAAGRKLDELEDKTKTTARRMDDSFDAIAKSSRQSLSRKLGEDVDDAKGKLHEAADEGRDTAREMFASFTDVSSFSDAAQEVSANVGDLFGPVGLVIGGALSAGIAIFQKRAEKIKETARDIANALIDSKGKIDEAFIQDKIKEFVDDGSIQDLAKTAHDAGIDVGTFLRAVAGDPKAIDQVNKKLDEQAAAMRAIGDNGTGAAADGLTQLASAQDKVRDKLDETGDALKSGMSDYQLFKSAVDQPVSASITVGIDIPTPRELDEINRRVRSGIGTVVVPVQGQNRFTNNANNSRYRW